MAAPYQWFDDADDYAASGRSIGGATLSLVDASDFGAEGSWSPPALISARRSDATVVVLVATGRTGNTLAISGPAPGWDDAAVQAGDRCVNALTRRDMDLIWAAIDGKQGTLTLTTTGSSGAATLVGSALNIPQYSGGGGGSGTVTSVSVATANGFGGAVATATTTPAIAVRTTVTGLLKGDGTSVSAAVAGTDYLAGNQAITLGGDLSGSGSTSITATIADNAVGTAKVAANAITYAKLQAAASAGIVGASAAGNYGHVTIGAGLSLSGGVLSSTVAGTVTSVGLTVPAGLSVSGSPVVGSGTLAVTLGVSGLLKGSAGAIVAAGAGDVTTTLIDAKAVTYAKLQDAAGAGVLGAGAAGAHQLLTLDDSVAITAGVVRARPIVCLGRWGTPTDAAGATGLMTRDTSAPMACVPYKIRIKAPTNPSGAGGGATIQVKVDGSDLLTAAYSLASGTTAWVTVSSGFALSSIADGASVQPSISAIGGDVRGLIVEVWARGA